MGGDGRRAARAGDGDRVRPAELIPDGTGPERADGSADRVRVRPGEERIRLRPGEIVEAAAQAARHFWWQILALAIPVSLVSSGLEILIEHYVDPADAPLSVGASLGSTGISLLGTVLLSAFACRLLGAAEHRRAPLTLPQLARSLPWWRLIAADVLAAVAVVVGLLLLILPGLAVLTLLAVVGPVIEIEHRRVFAAFRRSAQLTRHHLGSVVLLATVPLIVVAELEAIAPDPDRAGEIAEFLLLRGLAEGIVEACLAVVLSELCFRLIDAEAAHRGRGDRRRLPAGARPLARCDEPLDGLGRPARQQRAVLEPRQHVPGEQIALGGVRVTGQNERFHTEVGVAT
jgi:hypothetical protein